MKILWLTDIHLNFLSSEKRQEFYKTLVDAKPETIFISGDIAEGPSIVSILREMHHAVLVPIYFVLGNHDYWHSSVSRIKRDMPSLFCEISSLWFGWLNYAASLQLNEKTVLVGVDGWADGRYGDYINSKVRLWDSTYIEELCDAAFNGSAGLLKKMQELADRDARILKGQIENGLLHCPKKIIILTHIPPFEEACLYMGKASHPHYLPFYASKATGDVIIVVAKNNPSIEFLVLCGHTHGECRYDKLPNLKVWVGGAEYNNPDFIEMEI